MVWKSVCMAFIGFGHGIGVGTATVAFVVAIGVFPRIAQFTKTTHLMRWYESMATCGALFITVTTVLDISFHLPPLFLAVWGIFHGIFIGMLAAALAEIINIIPILTRRLRMEEQVNGILIALALGKVTGSLIFWLMPGFWE